MFNEIVEFYNHWLNSFKSILDDNMMNVFMSDGWNQFTKVLTNYMFDMKETSDKNMEKVLNAFRISSKSDMDELGDDIADLRQTIKSLKDKIEDLSKNKK